MEDTSGRFSWSFRFVSYQTTKSPATFSDSHENIDFSNDISKACSSCTISLGISSSKTLVFSCKTEFLEHFVGLWRVQLMCAFQGAATFPFLKTDRPNHSLRNQNFTFNQNYLARSVCTIDGFPAKTLGKSLFHCQNDWSDNGSVGRYELSDFVKRPYITSRSQTKMNFTSNFLDLKL